MVILRDFPLYIIVQCLGLEFRWFMFCWGNLRWPSCGVIHPKTSTSSVERNNCYLDIWFDMYYSIKGDNHGRSATQILKKHKSNVWFGQRRNTLERSWKNIHILIYIYILSLLVFRYLVRNSVKLYFRYIKLGFNIFLVRQQFPNKTWYIKLQEDGAIPKVSSAVDHHHKMLTLVFSENRLNHWVLLNIVTNT